MILHSQTRGKSCSDTSQEEEPMMPEPSGLSRRAHWAAGQPIGYLMAHALANPELVSLAAGFVDQQSLPVEATKTAFDAVMSDPVRARSALQYGTTLGYEPLREQVLAQLCQADGQPAAESNLSPDQVMITAGSNELLHVLADTLFDVGDIVLCAAPSYFVFLGICSNLGVRTVGVDCDEQGLIPAALQEQLERIEAEGELHRVKAIYVVTYFDNPGTVTLARDRRPEIVELAQRWSKLNRIYVVEDAAYRELRYFGEDIPSLRAFDPAGETVVITHTFSKSYSPGLRVGYGVLPPALVEPLVNQKGNIDFGSPNLAQHVMSAVLDLGLFEPQVERLRASYSEKMTAMLDAADEFLAPIAGVHWVRPQGGLYVWLQLPDELDAGPEGKLFDLALQQGVLYVPGQYCFPHEGVTPRYNTIRLSFGVQTPARIREGIAGLARAIHQAVDSVPAKKTAK